MDGLLRWGGLGLGILMTLHGIALIFTKDALLTGTRARSYWLFKGIEGLFGHTFVQALAVVFSLAIGVSVIYWALTWRKSQDEK